MSKDKKTTKNKNVENVDNSLYKLTIYYKDVKLIEMEEMIFMTFDDMKDAADIISKLYYVDYVILDIED